MSEDFKKNSNLCDSNKCKKNNECFDNIDKDCCCNLDTLRKILEIFQRENIELDIFIEASGLIVFSGFITNLTEDVVSVSEELGSSPTLFIPLCNMSVFSAVIEDEELRNEIREEIEDLITPTCNTNPCCCTDGIADAINGVRRFGDPTTGLCISTPSSTACPSIGSIVRANEDIVFLVVADSSFTIISTCSIDSVFLSSFNGNGIQD